MSERHSRDAQQPDDALLARLCELAKRVDPAPEAVLAAARSQLAYLRLDAELAQLTFDSRTQPEPAGVRSDTQLARRLTFESGTTQVEIEVVAEGERRRLVGQCLPATEVEVTVRHQAADTGSAADPVSVTTTDELGRFNVAVPAGTVSLRCLWPGAELTVETAWVRV